MPERGAVADRVVHQLRVGRQLALPRGDAQPATVDDRDVELVGVVGDRTLHDEQAAGGVEVVGEHVDDAGRLAVDGQRVRHRDRVAGRLGTRAYVDPHRLLVERGVAERGVVLDEVGARLVAGERDDAVLHVGLDRWRRSGRGSCRPAASSALGVPGSDPGRSLSSGRILIGWSTSPRTTSGSAMAEKVSRSSRSCTSKDSVCFTGADRPSLTEVLDLEGVPALARAGEADATVGGGAGHRARVAGAEHHRRVEDEGVTVAVVSPVGEHRDGDGAAGGHPPLAGLEAVAQRWAGRSAPVAADGRRCTVAWAVKLLRPSSM